jgi:hypothetical protein
MKTAHLALAGALSLSAMAAPVELPPEPKHKLPPPTTWWNTNLPSYVIQTSTGRVECPDRWYDAPACRPYVPGRDKRMRAFVRKEGDWIICPRPVGREGCVGIRQLPNMIEQE